MGRQSSRLFFGGTDHKDIYFDGYYHDKMYIGDELVWEKVENNNFRFSIYGTATGDITIKSGESGVVVDWGDGTKDSLTTIFKGGHDYDRNSNWTVTITGNLIDIDFRYSNLFKILDRFPPTMSLKSNFSYTFQGCRSLQSIPEGLFDNCPNVTTFVCTFSDCNSLQSIPQGLFDNCLNVVYYIDTFLNCSSLKSIPIRLFDNCPNVITFMQTFWGCSSLQSIPKGLFDNCPNVTAFVSTFLKCSSLQSIPKGLFDNCPNVTTFIQIYHSCSSLKSIPEGLFDNCPNVTNFERAFYQCSDIESMLPALWNRTKVKKYAECFGGCNKALNYAEVPTAWK